ncbi:MAG TPA: C39 family peptidase [Kofleriaceae bacterium]
MRPSSFRALFLVSALLAPACVADSETKAPDGQPPEVAPGDESTGSGSGDTPVANEKVLDHDYQIQQTYYWCGPAATRVALSVRMTPPSQQALANQLGTTTNGTDWIGQITGVLNDDLGGTYYVTTEMPNDPPTAAQRDRLWHDVVQTIDSDFAVVANIVAPPGNQPPGYPSDQTIYHYFSVVGYRREERQVYIADSANFNGNQHYWLTLDKLATLIPPKGYSSLVPQP